MTEALLEDRRHVEMALAACIVGRFDEAAGPLVEERRRRGEEPWILSALALVCRERGAYAQALEWADTAVRRGVDLAIGHAETGLVLSGLGRRTEAIAALARSLWGPLPHRTTIALALAEAWFDEGEIERAARLLADTEWDAETKHDAAALGTSCHAVQPALRFVASAPPDYAYQAGIRLLEAWRLGRRDLAERLSLRILRVAAEDADALGAVAILRMQQGRLDKADWLFGESLFRGPRHAGAIAQHYAVLLGRLNRFEAVVDVLGRIPAETLPAPMQALLGEALRQTGQPEEARRTAKAALSADPGASLARTTLWRIADDASVLSEAELAVETRPNDAALLFALARMVRGTSTSRAAVLAARALAIDPLLPDAADWATTDGTASTKPDVLSLPGLFAPKPDAGSAWPTEEQLRLLRIAFGEEVDAVASWARWCADHDIRDLDAGSYRLMPLVLRRLLGAAPEAAIPHRDLLRGIWRKSQIETVDRMRRSLPVIDALLEAGIAVMPLKGFLLAHTVYPDIGSRPMSDLDILVHASDVGRATAILEASGLRARRKPTSALLHFHYAITLREPSGGHIDLHWRPLHETVSATWTEDAVWAHAQPVNILGRQLFRATWTFQLFHTAVHGTAWNPIAPVRWVADSLLILATEGCSIDWHELDDLGARFNCRLALHRALRYLRENFSQAAAAIPAAACVDHGTATDEAVLLPLRSRPTRSRCDHREIAALCRRYAPLVADYDGALMAVIGGSPTDKVRAFCAANNIAWFPAGEPVETGRTLRERDIDLSFCVDGENNGGYLLLTRLDGPIND